VSITRTSGTGAAGTTDTYTITYSDSTTSTFSVYNGSNGSNGSNGTNGTDGAKWYTGSGAPSSGTGVDGDFYLRTNGDYYGPKTAGAWGSVVGSLLGPAGPSTFVEQTTPSSPAAGSQKLFIDSADHKLKRVNSSGTVTTIEGASSPSAPTIVSATQNDGSSSTASITIPASGLAAGDLMIAFVSSGYSGPDGSSEAQTSPPSGWASPAHSSNLLNSYDNLVILSRVYQAADAGTTVNWALGGSAGWAIHLFVVRNWSRISEASAEAYHGSIGSTSNFPMFPQGYEHRFTPGALVIMFAQGNGGGTGATVTLNCTGLTADLNHTNGGATTAASGHLTWTTSTVPNRCSFTTNFTSSGLAYGAVAIVGL
jgi:hypothetical protein